MAISDEKLKIVINNYFKSECDVNTSIREAFEKGFRIGVKKGLMQIGADRKTEPTISKMEQVDKDINVRSKDEPQTEDADCDKCIWSVCNYNKAFAFEDEPQTDCDGCQHYAYKHTADACYECSRSYADCYEPQTENLFTDKYGDVWEWRGDAWYCISGDEPQTDCAWK